MGSQTEDQLPRRERSGEDRAQSKQRQRRAEGRSHQKASGDVRESLRAGVGAPAEPRDWRQRVQTTLAGLCLKFLTLTMEGRQGGAFIFRWGRRDWVSG